MATFRVVGFLEPAEFEDLSSDLREAAGAGFRHLILDLRQSSGQTIQHWSAFRPVLDELTQRGTRLSVEGAPADLLDGLHNATIEAQLRHLDRQFPSFFSKSLI